ncbi:hypothetical protein [Sinorhizobium sp. RAC02]|uniref:hypothetical protein n=1 Tax=Sinorhizobium sp. RAC02 TaxID=1842534 RepID=UPI0012374B1E|nr:hypothetical protein [Sinorhizobium sp. RAC02]
MQLSSLFELETPGYDFDSCGISDLDQRRAFEAIVRLFCAMIALEGDLPKTSPKETFLEMRDFLERNGWATGDERARDLLLNVRATRNAIAATGPLHYNQAAEFQGQREQLRKRYWIESVDRADDEFLCEAVLTSRFLGNTAVHLRSRINGPVREMILLLAFDTNFERFITPFIRSEYIWIMSRMKYSASYSDSNSDPGCVKIDGRVGGRDGSAVCLDCFESGSYITQTCDKLGIPHASTQLFLEYHERYL